MQLPGNPDGMIDTPQVCEMADRYISAGGTYFDTSYVYDNGSRRLFYDIDRIPAVYLPGVILFCGEQLICALYIGHFVKWLPVRIVFSPCACCC